MIYGLDPLNQEEADFLLQVPVLITILIGDADHNLTRAEIEWAEKIARFRSVKGDKNVQDFYRNLEPVFHEKLEQKLSEYNQIALNNQYIVDRVYEDLKRTNPILEKLDPEIAKSLYQSFKSFAIHVAKASGNVLGMGGINPEEHRYISLDMLKDPDLKHQ